MYSTQPFEANSIYATLILGTLFWITVSAFCSGMLVIARESSDTCKDGILFRNMFLISFAIVECLFLFNIDKPVQPKNEHVIAHKVSYGSMLSSGKYPVREMYVVYKVPDGEVSFKMLEGTVYPDEAVLYRK
jgi:hypothetical protein